MERSADEDGRSAVGTAELVVRRPGLPEVRVPATAGLVIGRAAAVADLVLDDDLVSRKHARLHVDPRGYFRLEDLGSVNGIRFAERTVRRLNLVNGDVFWIGRTEMVFAAEMPRLNSAKVDPAPRVDTLLVDAAVPVPEAAPSDGLDGIEQLGWKAQASAGTPARNENGSKPAHHASVRGPQSPPRGKGGASPPASPQGSPRGKKRSRLKETGGAPASGQPPAPEPRPKAVSGTSDPKPRRAGPGNKAKLGSNRQGAKKEPASSGPAEAGKPRPTPAAGKNTN